MASFAGPPVPPAAPIGPTGPAGPAQTTRTAFYARQTSAQVADELRTSTTDGLPAVEAARRQREHGPNELTADEGDPLYMRFAEQLRNPLIMLLLGSAAVSVLTGDVDDAVSITLAIVIVVSVAFVQELRSEQSLKSLNKLVPYYCRTRRSGQLLSLLASELVPGDLVELETGDRVPADVRLVRSEALEVDESLLTGEAKPVRKRSEILGSEEAGLATSATMAFMGTLVRNGHAAGVVVATAGRTEFGHVFHVVKTVESQRTPLQAKMDRLGKQLSIGSFAVIGLIVLGGVARGRPLLEMFTIGVSLAVAAIPEGLPIVVTVTLALGVLRLARRQCIVKKLPTVESLGSVSVVCVDKTGTLTLNRMSVTQVSPVDGGAAVNVPASGGAATDTAGQAARAAAVRAHAGLQGLLVCANVCNNARRDARGALVGQPTEVALVDALPALGQHDDLRQRPEFRRTLETPFGFEHKWMAVECTDLGQNVTTFLKGAPDAVLPRCASVMRADGSVAVLDAAAAELAHLYAQQASEHGLRVLFFASGPGACARDPRGLSLLGLVGMHDPPREQTASVVRALQRERVHVAMITGDAAGTARAIAASLGILPADAAASATASGVELDKMSEADLLRAVDRISVFYRTTPRHKMAIVRAWQARGRVVAMTGDGVNDAPALRLADIGVAMGASGTDVAKEAADVILVNDELGSILHAVEEGKFIFGNIQNFLCFQLSTSVAGLLLISASTFLGWRNPLNAMQILWINIICDGPVAQSLGVEAVDPDVRQQPPRARDEPILDRDLLESLVLAALCILAASAYTLVSELGASGGELTPRVTTMVFCAFVVSDLFSSFACRSRRHSVFEFWSGAGDRWQRDWTGRLLSNRFWLAAVAFVLAGQLCVVYVPFFQSIFQTAPLALADWVFLAVIGSGALWAAEARKLLWARLAARPLRGGRRARYSLLGNAADVSDAVELASVSTPRDTPLGHLPDASSAPVSPLSLPTADPSLTTAPAPAALLGSPQQKPFPALLQSNLLPSPHLGPSAVLHSLNRSRPAGLRSSGPPAYPPAHVAAPDRPPRGPPANSDGLYPPGPLGTAPFPRYLGAQTASPGRDAFKKQR